MSSHLISLGKAYFLKYFPHIEKEYDLVTNHFESQGIFRSLLSTQLKPDLSELSANRPFKIFFKSVCAFLKGHINQKHFKEFSDGTITNSFFSSTLIMWTIIP